MSLVWHIVRKDLHRLRWLIRVWALLILAQFLFARIFAASGAVEFFAITWTLTYVVLPVTFGGILIGLQNEDAVAGRDEFWVTRPISSGQLLAAKGVSVALLVLVPIGLGLAWWLWNDFSAWQMGRAALHSALHHAIIVVAIAPLVVITRGPKEFFLGFLMAVAAAAVLYGIALWLSPITQATEAAQDGRAWTFIALWLITTAFVTGIQYRTGQRRLSILVIMLALLIGFVGWTRWIFDPELQGVARHAWSEETGGNFFHASRRAAQARDAEAFDTKIDGQIWRAETVLAVRPKPDEGRFARGYGVRIHSVVDNATGGPVIGLGQTQPDFSHASARLLFRPPQKSSIPLERWMFGGREEGVWLNNALLGSDGLLLWSQPAPGEMTLGVTVAAVSIYTHAQRFAPAAARGDFLPADVASWLTNAELRVVRLAPLDTR